MGGTCSIDGRDEKCIKYFDWKTEKGRDHSEYLSVDGWIILQQTLGEECERVWIRCIWIRTQTSAGLL